MPKSEYKIHLLHILCFIIVLAVIPACSQRFAIVDTPNATFQDSIDNSLKKISMPLKPTDDANFCRLGINEGPDCYCPEGYVRVQSPLVLGTACWPQLCMFAEDDTFAGDEGISNKEICASAISKEDASICSLIMPNQRDRDICFFTYVSFSGNMTYCERIFDNTIMGKCYETL